MPVYKTARFRVRRAGLDQALAAVQIFVCYVKANEPGTLQYTSVQRADDPTQFLHFFTFESEAAQNVHSTSEGVKNFTDVLYPLLDGEQVEFTDHVLVAST